MRTVIRLVLLSNGYIIHYKQNGQKGTNAPPFFNTVPAELPLIWQISTLQSISIPKNMTVFS